MRRDRYRQIIPNPHAGQIDSVLIREILKQAGISAEDWLNS